MSDITVTFKNQTILTMDASGSEDFLTQGKYCEDDISITYVKPSGGGQQEAADLISGTLSGVYANPLVTEVKQQGLRGLPNVTEFNLPNCILIQDSGFRYNDSVRRIYVPKATGTASNYLFANCRSLEVIALPSFASASGLTFQSDTSLAAVHYGPNFSRLYNQAFVGCTALATLVLRRVTALVELANINVFNNTPFASGGSGGTAYIPKALYDHLGDGTALDYKAATNWATIEGYGTITWAQIEGSIYETQYADGTQIS